jgi:hypothetical protein
MTVMTNSFVFFNDSDEESEFEGFSPEDILMNAELRVKYAMDQSSRDREVEFYTDIGWKMEDSQPTCCPFFGNTGLKIDLPDNPAPIDFFNYLFDAEVFEILTEQTNIYAQQRKNDRQFEAPFTFA